MSMVELKWAYMGVIVKLSKFTIYAYTVNTKSNLGTPKCQFFPTFLVFSESVHQKEWENAQGDMKIGKVAKWNTLIVNSPHFSVFLLHKEQVPIHG